MDAYLSIKEAAALRTLFADGKTPNVCPGRPRWQWSGGGMCWSNCGHMLAPPTVLCPQHAHTQPDWEAIEGDGWAAAYDRQLPSSANPYGCDTDGNPAQPSQRAAAWQRGWHMADIAAS